MPLTEVDSGVAKVAVKSVAVLAQGLCPVDSAILGYSAGGRCTATVRILQLVLGTVIVVVHTCMHLPVGAAGLQHCACRGVCTVFVFFALRISA